MAGYLKNERIGSSDGIHELALYLWETGERPRGIVQVVHGVCRHMSHYADFAEYLNRHGYIVCGHDHLGHGKTAEPGGDFGHFAGTHGSRVLVRDARRVTKWAVGRFPELPLFLLGDSMGSLIGRIYILKPPEELAGFLCVGTPGDRAYMPLARIWAECASRLRGAGGSGRIMTALMNLGVRRRIPREDGALGWLSRDSAVREAYTDDPYAQRGLTNRACGDLIELQVAACSKQWANHVPKSMSVFFLSGGDDPIGGFGRGVVQAYERLRLAGVSDVRCKLYEGARHELLHELNREEVYYDILSWMDSHLPQPFGDGFFV